jgi:hypothetical protein
LTSLRQLEAFGRSDGVKRDGRMVKVLRCDVEVVDKDWGNRMLICTNHRGHRVHLGGGSTIAGISPLLGKAIELTPNLEEIELVCYTLRVDPHRKLLLKGLQAIKWVHYSVPVPPTLVVTTTSTDDASPRKQSHQILMVIP